jgi:catechol 2,3-dioxygenase
LPFGKIKAKTHISYINAALWIAILPVIAKTGAAMPEHAALPDATRIGSATLRVADEKRALALYCDIIGLKVVARENGRVALGTGATPFLFLEIRPGSEPRPRRGLAGLFHVAILLPDRAALGSAITRLGNAGIRLGAADHNVSEAIYLYDDDGNGLEIYRDRPRAEWPWQNGLVQMVNKPLNFDGILAEGGKEEPDEHMPAGTRIGHVHLQVGDLADAEKFYVGTLGFAKTAALPGALFAAAGGYHHHIATNIWDSQNAPPPPAEMAGLSELVLEIPQSEMANVKARIRNDGGTTTDEDGGLVITDPWRTRIRIAPMQARAAD